MRRAALVIGGFVSLTAVAAFIYVMQGPVAFHPAQRKGHPSPIALVMEHLNKPISDSLPSDAPQPTASGAQFANPTAATRAMSRAVAAQSSPESSQFAQPVLIPVPARGAASSNTAAPDISASWTGFWQAVAGPANLPLWFAFRQESAKLTVVAAPDSAAHYLLLHAQMSGDSIRFELHDGQRTLLYDLRVEGNELRGAVTVSSAKETRTIAVRFARAN